MMHALERLDVQISLFSGTQARQLHQPPRIALPEPLPANLDFGTVPAVAKAYSHNSLMARGIVHLGRMHEMNPQPRIEDHDFLQRAQGKLAVSCARFESALLSELQMEPPRSQSDRMALEILHLYHLTSRLMALTVLSFGREVLCDNHMEEFARMVSLCSSILSSRQSDTPAFSMDWGVQPPLFLVVHRCRHPVLRRRALELLRTLPSRESFLSGKLMAEGLDLIIASEERGLPVVQNASDVPEHQRAAIAYFDFEVGMSKVYCRRRCFEGNGEWIEYVEPPEA